MGIVGGLRADASFIVAKRLKKWMCDECDIGDARKSPWRVAHGNCPRSYQKERERKIRYVCRRIRARYYERKERLPSFLFYRFLRHRSNDFQAIVRATTAGLYKLARWFRKSFDSKVHLKREFEGNTMRARPPSSIPA